MSRGFDELIKLAMNVREESASDAGAIVYVPQPFTSISFPHKRVTGSEYTRRNGKYTLYVFAPSNIGIPYGVVHDGQVGSTITNGTIRRSDYFGNTDDPRPTKDQRTRKTYRVH